MKAAVWLVTVCGVGWVAWNFLGTPVRVATNSQPVSSATKEAPPPQAPTQPLKMEPVIVGPEQVVVIRGRVIGRVNGVMMVSCDPDPEPDVMPVNIDGRAGAAEIEGMAKWALHVRDREISKEFGPLRKISTAAVTPQSRPIGRFAVYGYPEERSAIHVVAAETGAQFEGVPLYSVQFHLAGDMVVNSPFPPGVDTPEQRRAYLQKLAKERKERDRRRGY